MWIAWIKTTTFGVAIVASGLLGCSAIENAIDCHGICERYASCYNASYDVAKCEARCRDGANNDGDYMQKSDTCNACLTNNKDCVSTTFNCGGQCAGIVP